MGNTRGIWRRIPIFHSSILSNFRSPPRNSLQTFAIELSQAFSISFFKTEVKLKKTLEFKRFQERKLVLENACSMARRLIFTKNSTFEELKRLQQATLTGKMKDEDSCTPVLPIKSAKNENFYSDQFKYSMCLPPKEKVFIHFFNHLNRQMEPEKRNRSNIGILNL